MTTESMRILGSDLTYPDQVSLAVTERNVWREPTVVSSVDSGAEILGAQQCDLRFSCSVRGRGLKLNTDRDR